MKKLFVMISTLCPFLCSTTIFAQAPTIQWQKCLGGSWNDEAYSVQQTFDGGYIVAGYTMSNDGDVTGYHGAFDYWVVKLNAAGELEWEKCLGGSGYDAANSIEQTTDSGYIIIGTTSSIDGNVTGFHGAYDYWVVKIDIAGNIQWEKCYGGSGTDIGTAVRQTTDGGYILAGYSESTDGQVTGNHGEWDYWIVRIDDTGGIQWERSYGGSDMDEPYSIQQTEAGGYVIVGYTKSSDGDVTGPHGDHDFWIVKINDTGDIQWQKCLGGSGDDEACSVHQTTDKGYIVAGFTSSYDGDVVGNHGSGEYDDWIVKLDSTGNIDWKKCYGGSDFEMALGIDITSDGGYIVAGRGDSPDGDVTGTHNLYDDYWILKLDDTGKIQWQQCYGGDSADVACSIQQTIDNGYIIAGYTRSNDGEVSGLHGQGDYWVVKLNAATIVPILPSNINNAIVYPNPTHDIIYISEPDNTYNQLLALDGRTLLQTRERFIDLSPFPAGLYLLSIFDENNVKLKTELIEKV